MKLFGSNGNGNHKHRAENSRLRDSSIDSPSFEKPEVRAASDGKPADNASFVEAAADHGEKRRKKTRRTLIIVAAAVAVLAIGGVALWKSTVKPPELIDSGLSTPEPAATEAPVVTQTPAQESEAPVQETPEPTPEQSGEKPELSGDRKEGCYTILVMGTDYSGNLTDTIMIARFDTTEHKIDVVSVPRDTLVNVVWESKKINTIYASRGKSMEKVRESFRDLLGFTVDNYALVNLQAFEEIIDAVGGIDYDVPIDMYYRAPDEGLEIAIPAGPTHLSGEEALKVMRFRSGYVNADLGRIDTQHDFLLTAAKQVLQLKNVLAIDDIIKIMKEYVETDLTVGNLAWFAGEFFNVDSAGISFLTAPIDGVSIKGGSYVALRVNQWLDMVNSSLNPYNTEVTVSNVNILYYDGGPKSTTGTIAGGMDSFFDYVEYFRSLGLSDDGTTSTGATNSEPIGDGGAGLPDDDGGGTEPASGSGGAE